MENTKQVTTPKKVGTPVQNTITGMEAMKKTLADSNEYNSYRKEKGETYTLIKTEEAMAFLKTLTSSEVLQLCKCWLFIRKIQSKLRAFVIQLRKDNKQKAGITPEDVYNEEIRRLTEERDALKAQLEQQGKQEEDLEVFSMD